MLDRGHGSNTSHLNPLWTGGGGGGGQVGPSPGFSSITQKLFNQSSPNFVTLVIHIYAIFQI